MLINLVLSVHFPTKVDESVELNELFLINRSFNFLRARALEKRAMNITQTRAVNNTRISTYCWFCQIKCRGNWVILLPLYNTFKERVWLHLCKYIKTFQVSLQSIFTGRVEVLSLWDSFFLCSCFAEAKLLWVQKSSFFYLNCPVDPKVERFPLSTEAFLTH